MDQTQSTTSNPATLDPQAVNLTKAIRQVESNGNFQAQGKSGEYGAYQFMPQTWDALSKKFGVNAPLQTATPEQQNEVAYKQVKELKDQGYNVGQIASLWNSGNPNSYLDPNAKGVNQYGASYDVPAYAQKVALAYQGLKQQNGLGAFTPQPYQEQFKTATTPYSATQTNQNQPDIVQNAESGNILSVGKQGIGGVVGNIVNFAFPVVNDLIKDATHGSLTGSGKTILQQLGDAGMSALWFLPFGDIAEAGATALKALRVGEGVARGAGVVGAGLAGGYASDVASHLAQGQTNGGVFRPGAGTITGGALGAAGLGAASLYGKFLSQQSAVDKVEQAYADAGGATKTEIKQGSKTAMKGLDPNAEFLAYAGIAPETQELNGRRVFTTGPDSNSQTILKNRETALSNLRDEVIANAAGGGNVTSLSELQAQSLAKAKETMSGSQQDTAVNFIKSEFKLLASQGKYAPTGDRMTLKSTNELKMYLANHLAKYDATRPTASNQAAQIMADVARSSVENEGEKAGIPGIKELNKIIQQHIDARDFLTRINGQTIKGGRLGGYFKGAAGAVVGGAVGRTIGGPVGEAVGVLAGEHAGGIVSRWLQKLAVGGPMTAATLGRVATKEPAVVEQFLKMAGREGENIAPVLQPALKTSAGKVVTGLLKKLPARAPLVAATRGTTSSANPSPQ